MLCIKRTELLYTQKKTVTFECKKQIYTEISMSCTLATQPAHDLKFNGHEFHQNVLNVNS